MDIDTIKCLLQDHGVRPSLPRIKIYEYLDTYHSHPTVDEIYLALVPELITLSKTTVYNTMDLFQAQHLVIPILIEDNETRYDSITTNHGHFKCLKCGKIYDFDFDLSNTDIPKLEGFKMNDYHTYIKGVCKACKEAE